MSETVKIPNVDLIRDMLKWILDADIMGYHIALSGDADCLQVFIYGDSSSGPCLNVYDLQRIQEALVGPGPFLASIVFISAGERPKDLWTYIKVAVKTVNLKDDVCTVENRGGGRLDEDNNRYNHG